MSDELMGGAGLAESPAPDGGGQDYSGIDFFEGIIGRQSENARDDRMVADFYDEQNWFNSVRQSTMEPIWNECYRLYRLQVPDERFSGEWRSKINVPYAFTNVEDITPQLMAAIWEADPLFRITSDTKPDIAEARERLLKKQITDMNPLEMEWLLFQKQKALYGTTIGYTGFKALFRQKRSWGKVTNPLMASDYRLAPRVDEVAEYVGPYFRMIDLFNVWVHPRAEMQDPKKIFWQEWHTLEYLQKSGIYKNLDRLQDVAPSIPNWMSNAQIRQNAIGGQNTDSFRYQNNEYRIVKRFDDVEKRVYSYVEDRILIQEEDYPDWDDKCPLVFDRYTSLPGEFYAMGVIEPSIALIHEGNTVRNQRRDNMALILNSMFEINSQMLDMEDDEDLASRPGMLWWSRDGNSVRPIQPPNVTQDAYLEENKIAMEIKGITGLQAPMTGQGDSKVTSASGTSLLQKASLLRLNQANRQQILCFKSVLAKMDALNCQYYPLESVKKALAPLMFSQWQDSLPEDITQGVEIQVQPAGTYENKDIRRQQFVNLLNILGGNPIFAQQMDWPEMLKRLLKEFDVHDIPGVMVKNETIDILELMFAHQENKMMSMGQQIPPALPNQNKTMHMQMHETLLQQRPDLFMVIGQHEQSHNMAELQKQQMMLQGQGAQGGGPGGGPGGANPARQPQSSSQEGVIKNVMRTANANA